MTLTGLHGYLIGYAVVGSWVVVGVWALVLRLARRQEAPVFWRAVSVAQVLLGVQLLFGIVLLLLGRRPGPAQHPMPGMTLLFHLLYGLGFPLVVLVVAHAWARARRYDPFTVFAVAGLVNFGLTLRALQVGIGGF